MCNRLNSRYKPVEIEVKGVVIYTHSRASWTSILYKFSSNKDEDQERREKEKSIEFVGPKRLMYILC